MHSIRRSAVVLRAGLTLALALAALFIPATGAHASQEKEAKKLKRALVRIEDRLDLAEGQIRALKKTEPERREHLKNLERQLPLMSAQTDTFSSFNVVGSIVRYTQLSLEESAVEESVDELRRDIAGLTQLRHQKIGELQGLVIEAQKVRATSPLIVGGSIVTYSADWEAVAQCESSGNWQIDAYFDGGLQFLPSTWIGFGGGELARYAYQATKTEQIAIAERVLAIQGPKAWPNCFKPLPFDSDVPI